MGIGNEVRNGAARLSITNVIGAINFIVAIILVVEMGVGRKGSEVA